VNSNLVFVANACCTLYLVGLIWMVQCVHYKLLDRVGTDSFQQYEADHNRLITPIVSVPMLIELFTSIALVAGNAPPWMPQWSAILGLIGVVLIWLSTLFLQVPFHATLMQGFNADAYQGLVTSNWIRTGLWSARGLLVAYLMWCGLRE